MNSRSNYRDATHPSYFSCLPICQVVRSNTCTRCNTWLLSCQAGADLQGSEAQMRAVLTPEALPLDGPNWVFVPAALFAEVKALCLWGRTFLPLVKVVWNLFQWEPKGCMWWFHEIPFVSENGQKYMLKYLFIGLPIWFFLRWLVGTRESVLVSLVLTCCSLLCCATLCYGKCAQGMFVLPWTARPLACFPLRDGPVICICLGDVAILRAEFGRGISSYFSIRKKKIFREYPLENSQRGLSLKV